MELASKLLHTPLDSFSHGPGATHFSGSFSQPCSPPCRAFSRENTAELAHLCACKAQQKLVKRPGAAAPEP